MAVQATAISLLELNQRIVQRITYDYTLQNVWVTAETSDVRVAGGHCYLELIEKNPENGRPVAKIRAAIWASNYYRIASKFQYETGQQFCSDLKVMVLVSTTFNPVYGLSLTIHDINAAYTLGDVMRRRNEMIQRLVSEGIINMNREKPWPLVPQHIAIISAQGAAGYGDFINQLYNNSSRLRFTTRLFEAAMQGERTAPSIIAALDQVARDDTQWDCVVIIRGGGASADLLWFDNYDLAANIANFPIPVVIGIGHERDITLLDYVANMRVKTPTAAAEWLIQKGDMALGNLQMLVSNIHRAVTDRLSGCHKQLSYIAGALPAAAANAVTVAKNRLAGARLLLATVADKRLRPEAMRLDNYLSSISQAIEVTLQRQRTRLDTDEKLVELLSPISTLRRGYSITRIAGHAITDAASASEGDIIETVLADGTLTSIVKTK